MVTESGPIGPSPARPAGKTPSQPSAPARRAQRPRRAGGCFPPASTYSRDLSRLPKTHLQPYHRSHGRHSRKSVLEKAQQMCNKLIWPHVTSLVACVKPLWVHGNTTAETHLLGTSPVVGWPLAFRECPRSHGPGRGVNHLVSPTSPVWERRANPQHLAAISTAVRSWEIAPSPPRWIWMNLHTTSKDTLFCKREFASSDMKNPSLQPWLKSQPFAHECPKCSSAD